MSAQSFLAAPWRAARKALCASALALLCLVASFASRAEPPLPPPIISQGACVLPVLAGQSGNTGCQALAVTLRGITLGELKPGTERALVAKEAGLGMLNGVGLTAGSYQLPVAGGMMDEPGCPNPSSEVLTMALRLTA